MRYLTVLLLCIKLGSSCMQTGKGRGSVSLNKPINSESILTNRENTEQPGIYGKLGGDSGSDRQIMQHKYIMD